MEYTLRKRLRWEYWNYNNSGSCFLTICTKAREKCLSRIRSDPNGIYPYDSDDHRLSVELTEYGRIVERVLQGANKSNGLSVDHYVIMPDHIHVIVTVTGENWEEKEIEKAVHEKVPKFLSSFKTLCHKAAGEKFLQRSGYDHVIRNQEDYLALVEYIQTNPLRWELDKLYSEK